MRYRFLQFVVLMNVSLFISTGFAKAQQSYPPSSELHGGLVMPEICGDPYAESGCCHGGDCRRVQHRREGSEIVLMFNEKGKNYELRFKLTDSRIKTYSFPLSEAEKQNHTTIPECANLRRKLSETFHWCGFFYDSGVAETRCLLLPDNST